MKRVTCRICGKRRIPWFKRWRGDSVVKKYSTGWLAIEVRVRPLSPYICGNCVEEKL
ncbi:hypothetical protein LCGC14_1718650 [marine sediment metagenome]|uniref:Uncharacterized protein n=1 Tax=marine sediment metagenome TaxID=412755 RepID=A0A0F9HDD7_9ZZZZ